VEGKWNWGEAKEGEEIRIAVSGTEEDVKKVQRVRKLKKKCSRGMRNWV
jgi:predicted DNA-binding antitoxin AbrB/MazE fold protein